MRIGSSTSFVKFHINTKSNRTTAMVQWQSEARIKEKQNLKHVGVDLTFITKLPKQIEEGVFILAHQIRKS